MNSRLASLGAAARCFADACCPVLRPYKVKYFKKIPFEGQPGMFAHEWTEEIEVAYNKEEAARKVNPKLRPGKNCFVTRLMPWEKDNDAV